MQKIKTRFILLTTYYAEKDLNLKFKKIIGGCLYLKVKRIDFSLEPTNQKLPKSTIIQGAHFIDLYNDYADPNDPAYASAGLRIYDVDNNGKNEFFISQGTVQIIPNPNWGVIRLLVGTSHFFGGVGTLTINAFDCSGSLVSTATNTIGKQGIVETLLLIAPEICYIEIRGQEVAIDKIDFLVEDT